MQLKLSQLLLVPFMLLFITSLYGQKKIIQQPMIWYSYVQNIKINERFTIQTDVQERHYVQPIKQHQWLIRTELRTTIKPNIDFGTGLAFFLSNTDISTTKAVEVPEVRPHIEINQKQPFKRVTIAHRYKLEARFFQKTNINGLENGFKFNCMRFRYQFALDIQLNKPKNNHHALKLKLIEEVMLNFGKAIKYNTFDQNRAYILLQYAPIPALTIEAGYLNVFQQRSTGDKYNNRNTFKIGIIHNINLSKRQKTSDSNQKIN